MWFCLLAEVVSGASAACSPLEVVPPGDAVAVDLGGAALPRGSLVVARMDPSCAGSAVEVRSVVWFYREAGRPLADVGSRGCLAPETLRPPVGTWVSLQGGEAGPCGEGGRYLGTSGVAALAPVRARYRELFGGGGTLLVDDWGRVALPLAHVFNAEELAAEWAREGLDTDKRREKAVDGLGPLSGTIPVYAHFTGSDPPMSDLWGEPWAVADLLTLASDWFEHCSAEVSAGRLAATVGVAACTLQVGDLAYYRDLRPDPLGHRDHDGTCADLRLFRDDGSRYEAWWNRADDRPGEWGGYSRPLTGEFVRWVRSRLEVGELIFNDPEVQGPRRARGHDDHIHLCFLR